MGVIVFDLDDTLFPEEQFVLSGFRAVDTWLETYRQVRGFFPVAKHLFHSGERRAVFDLALRALAAPFDGTLIATLVAVYRDHFPHIELFEDAEWAIGRARRKGQTAIITDGYLATQKNKVRALGLEGRFDLIVYSDMFGADGWKPNPRPYREVMSCLGCGGDSCVYVGDNPAKDFVTARMLGWKTVRIAREGGIYRDVQVESGYEADQVIFDLRQLKCIMEEE